MKSILIFTLLVTIGPLLCIYIDGFSAVLEEPYLYHIQMYQDLFAIAEPLFSELNSAASFGSPVYGDNLTFKDNELNSTVHQFDIGSGDWHIEDPAILSSSLRLDVKKGNTTNWSVLSTDFIPAITDSSYNFSLDIVAVDVNQLHPKVYSYDSNKSEIDSKIISWAMDGTSNKTFANIFYTPSNTSYVKLQLWVLPNPQKDSYYILESNKSIISGPIGFQFNIDDSRYEHLADKFKSEIVFKSNRFLTSMSFLDYNDILVLEKNSGKVQRIINGQMLDEPVLDVDVASKYDRGLLGIAIMKEKVSEPENGNNPISVFLFFTESRKDNSDECPKPDYCKYDGNLLGNRLYKYEFDNGKLINPKLILSIPSSTHPIHPGGTLKIDKDNKHIYITSGDGSFGNISSHLGDNSILNVKSSNEQNGFNVVGRGGILKIGTNGTTSESGILGSSYPLNLYYAYGIRNSFGIDIDPVTGNLWDTENGPIYGDEINLVEPGFNSGWDKVQGIWYNNGFLNGTRVVGQPNTLVNFGGNGSYSSPEFVWYRPSVAPTALIFLDSDKYGKEYENDMLVGDYQNGLIYHFDLNKNRTDLSLEEPLKDGVADSPDELRSVIFGQYFNGITDMDLGPDGYLYVLSNYGTSGGYEDGGISIIYRLVPR